MNIPFVPTDPSNYYSGRGGNSIKYIVLHYTANNGDTAQNNADYFAGANRRASAHYFVDENEVVQSVRDTDAAWHCGGSIESDHHPLRGVCTNHNSLGVEMCSDIVGCKYVITAQTVDLAVQLVRQLMAKYRIPIDRVVRHYDVTGKACPEPWVHDESLWRKFKARLTAPVEPEPKKEDDEVVEKKKVLLNGKTYECDVITKDATNYIKMRSLQQAGFMIGYDAVRKVPSITAPQCRTFVPDGDEDVQAAVDTLQESAGLEKQTIEYLLRYQYGEQLIRKLAEAMAK
jgi:N-acetylmuramoyl-L-alanine amidase CwlA